MPTLPITDVPVQISQSITQTALLQNTGTPNVYLANDSSVSPSAYGMVLTNGSSCVWPANSDLWAVTETGERSSVSVLYGASGASLGQVSATIDGPVDAVVSNPLTVSDILAPVQVQGGGEILLNFNDVPVNIAPGDTYVQELTTDSGLVYPAIDMNIFFASTSEGRVPWELTKNPLVSGVEVRGTVYSPTYDWPFYPQGLRAIVPNNTGQGLYLVVFNPLATNLQLLGTIYGTSTAPVTAVTPTWDLVQLADQPLLLSGDATIYLPASFTPYNIGIYAPAATSVSNITERVGEASGSVLRAKAADGPWPLSDGYRQWPVVSSGEFTQVNVVSAGSYRLSINP